MLTGSYSCPSPGDPPYSNPPINLKKSYIVSIPSKNDTSAAVPVAVTSALVASVKALPAVTFAAAAVAPAVIAAPFATPAKELAAIATLLTIYTYSPKFLRSSVTSLRSPIVSITFSAVSATFEAVSATRVASFYFGTGLLSGIMSKSSLNNEGPSIQSMI